MNFNKEELRIIPFKVKEGTKLQLYVIPKTEAIRKRLEEIDKDYSYTVNIAGDWTYGNISVSKDAKTISRTSLMKTKEVDVFGNEDNVFNKTANQFGIGFLGKVETSYFADDPNLPTLVPVVEAKGRGIESAIVLFNGRRQKVNFMKPTEDMIDRILRGEDVRDDVIE